VRAGGKHNDLDNVGYTARHHTFFEMLGNFSFGDYFKERAIELAWNLITKEFGLPTRTGCWSPSIRGRRRGRGSGRRSPACPKAASSASDLRQFLGDGRYRPLRPVLGDLLDHGPKIPGGPPGSADEDGDRFIEIWNLVFMQFEQVRRASASPLPKPSIDTGMGLERIAACSRASTTTTTPTCCAR
jgi:alanyl-tRNA synthetase